jgi:saccharopine dehydrogenase (NAD+, L-lysine forming)
MTQATVQPSKVIVLGGCGAVGSVAVQTLAKRPEFSEVIIGDIQLDKAKSMAASLGGNVTARAVDASDPASIQKAISGCDLVLNCVGPFYKTVKAILSTVIECGINYIDVCDDVDVTEEIFALSEKAERAGVTALIGMGSSPGVTNILAAFAANTLLEETESVDIFHAHGGEPFEGPGVIGHRFHCMSIDIPMFLDGKLEHVKYFEEDGIALREPFHFPVLDEKVLLYPYPHPEQVTLPRHIKLKQVTNKGTVLPASYYELTRDICKLGLSRREPVKVNGQDVVPYDFAVSYIIEERDRILKETNFGTQRGCVSVIVKGTIGGEHNEFHFHLASKSQALGEGTGIPAAMGTILLQQGKISKKGVFPPEAGVEPTDFMALLPEVMKLNDDKEGGDSFGGVIVQRVDADGNISNIDIL